MQQKHLLNKILQTLIEYTNKKDKQKINYNSLTELENKLDLTKQDNLEDWDQLFVWVEKYLKYSIDTSNPNFVNRMWSGANLPSIIGEIITAFTNTSACTLETAPVATLMERYMIEQMLKIVGFKNGEGQMTTGSSNANMIAMMIARNKALKEVKKQGLFKQKTLFAIVSKDSHYSLDKAANILGIGTLNLIKIPTLKTGQMNTLILEKEIDKIKRQDGILFFVCATLGTTVLGAYDSIIELLKIKQKHNFWLHGDGAWGGSAIMSPYLKDKFLTGIEKLDSFTIDFHKMLGSNLICNFLLINHKKLLLNSCSGGDNSYIFRSEENDLGVSSLQCGRRVDSLKAFLDWKFYQRKGFANRIENYYKLAKFAENFIEQSNELEMITKRVSFNVCFRFKTKDIDPDIFNKKLRNELYTKNGILLCLSYIDKKPLFRLLINNVYTNKEKLIQLFNSIIKTGMSLKLLRINS
jgi:sulfinoalanine decarboxylase